MGNTTFQLVLLGLLIALYLAVEWRTVRAELRAFVRHLRRRPQVVSAPLVTPSPIIPVDDVHVVPGTQALAHPPMFTQLCERLHRAAHDELYPFPIGWTVTEEQSNLIYAAFVRGANHILITGKSDSGKDNAALNMLFALCLRYRPTQLQVCVIDGKGLDFVGWQDRAHCWKLALESREIKPAMAALTAERERRGRILREAECSKWDEYQGDDLPLLVCYISELSLLQDATSKSELGTWLNSELAAGRAFGMRYIVATQTASNFDTRWRSQMDLFLAGYQPLDSQDEPNTGLTTKKIKELGSVPPSELPEASDYPGVFCAVQGRKVLTVRTTYLDTAERRHWLVLLPGSSVEPVPGVPQTPLLDGSRTGSRTSSASSDMVPPDTTAVEPEALKIRHLALQGKSRNYIADKLGGNRQKALERIRLVLSE